MADSVIELAKPNEEGRIKEIDNKIKEKVKELENKRESKVYLFLDEISNKVVGDVYQDLRNNFSKGNTKLDVIIDSGGGDIHSAFNLASLFRKYGTKELNFIIPRWAKSAATLIVCGGDKILMTPIAELGPLDPQITEINPIEQRVEEYTPLQLESTLNLIREEINKGNGKLGELLLKRLQFPMTLGGIMKSIEVGEQYLKKLLISRMFKGYNDNIKNISEKLTKGYCDHAFCINIEEASEIGLKVEEINDGELEIIWEIYILHDEKRKLKEKIKKEKMRETIKDLPNLPEELKDLMGISDEKSKIKEDKNV